MDDQIKITEGNVEEENEENDQEDSVRGEPLNRDLEELQLKDGDDGIVSILNHALYKKHQDDVQNKQ